MHYRFYESKILYILISILMLIQLGAFFVQRMSNRNIIEQTVSEELMRGSQVFSRILESRNAQLEQTAEVLVSDYGLREAVAMAAIDTLTVQSMLHNHGQRANASLVLLADLHQQIIAATPSNVTIQPEAFDQVASTMSSQQKLHLATFSIDAQQTKRPLFHIVNSEVKAPHHIANLVIGYEIDQHFVADLRKITDIEFFFISKSKHGWSTHASTLPAALSQRFIRDFNPTDIQKLTHVRTTDSMYLMWPIPISEDSQQVIYAVVAKSLAQAMRPYQRSEQILAYLLVITILLSVLAIYFVTQKIVHPLNEQAHMDNLTGLGNRRMFQIIFGRALTQLKQTDAPFALMMLDLNKFKQINDTKGHDIGDLVLKTTASRLKSSLRNSDSIFRLGGDEFAVVLENCTESGACSIAEKIGAAIAQPIDLPQEQLTIRTSIGIAFAPQDSAEMDSLIKQADTAMYLAKTTQKPYCCYHDTVDNGLRPLSTAVRDIQN